MSWNSSQSFIVWSLEMLATNWEKINNEKIQEKVYCENQTFRNAFQYYVHEFMHEVYEIASLQGDMY